MYLRALEEMKAGMDTLSPEEVSRIFEVIGRLGNGLKHLPYAALPKASCHEFGVLRLWCKLKSFKVDEGVVPLSWSAFKWRPLVSFRKHRWRRVFSLLSRF